MIKINLIGDSANAKARVHREVGFLFVFMLAFVAVGVLGHLWFSNQVLELQSGVDGTARELTYVRALAQRVRALEAQQAEAAAQLKTLEALARAKEGTVRILDSLVNSVPERAWLTELRETEQGFKVSGLAQDGEAISNLARELEKSSSFVGVKIEVAKLNVREGVKFQEFSVRAQRAHSKPPLVKAQMDASKGKATK